MANMEGMEGILSAFDVPLPDRCASMDVFERFLQDTFQWQNTELEANLESLFPTLSPYRHQPSPPHDNSSVNAADSLRELDRQPHPWHHHHQHHSRHDDHHRLNHQYEQQQQQQQQIAAAPHLAGQLSRSPFAGTAVRQLGVRGELHGHLPGSRPGGATGTSSSHNANASSAFSNLTQLPTAADASAAHSHISAMQQLLRQAQPDQQQHASGPAALLLLPPHPHPQLQQQQQQQQLPPTVQQPPATGVTQPPQDSGTPHQLARDSTTHSAQQQTTAVQQGATGQSYSKGYLAVKRYREKKRGKVKQMEEEVAKKLAELERLQDEHSELLQRHRAVQATVEVQDELLSQVNNLTLSLGLNSSDSTATAAVAAAAPTVPAAPSGADSTPPGGSTCQPSTSQQHLQQQLQQQQQAAQQQRQYMEEAHVLLERYQSYVTQVAKLLTHHALQPPGNSAAAPGARVVPCALPGTDTVDGTGFPPWPLTMKETLVLYRLGRYASAPQPQQVILGGSSDGGNSSGAAAAVATDDLRLLNVQTGRHEKIPSTLAELWQKAAADVSIRPHQVLQLEAGWQVVRAAIEQLNKEREQLLERLRIAAGQLGGIAMGGQPTSRAAAAAAAADGVVGDHSAGCSTKLWLSEGALALAEYDALADGVEATLVRGRAINVMTSWSMLLIFDNEQVARMMVACYPYFPLIRGVVGCLLNKPELLVHSA